MSDGEMANEILAAKIGEMAAEIRRLQIKIKDIGIALEKAKVNCAYWEDRWRKTNQDLYIQCNITGKMRERIFELTGERLGPDMNPVDVEAVKRMYDNIGSRLD